jgi:glutamate dehydrogenase (NAD(P)+)
MDPDDVKLFISQGMGKSLTSYHDVEQIETFDPSKIMNKKCDIFAPCAGDGTLHANNAGNLNTKIVIEGANGPTTFMADKILEEKGI